MCYPPKINRLEETIKLEEIREELITKQVNKLLKLAQKLVNLIYTTTLMSMKGNYTTKENLFLNQKYNPVYLLIKSALKLKKANSKHRLFYL